MTGRASRATGAKARARLGDLAFTVIDTAGFDEAAPDSLTGRMLAQTEAAIAAADAVLFLIDARAGLTPIDRRFADVVRRAGKPVIVVANKSEGRAGAGGALEAYELGLGDPVAISAEHGEGLSDLYDAIRAALAGADGRARPKTTRRDRRRRADRAPIRVAVVGRPNAGKSTLINRLLGEERLLTGPEAGITRDAIAVDLDWRGRRFRLYDTAGHAAQVAHRGEARKALGRRHAQCDPLRRSRDRADGCASARSRSRTCASPIWWSARAGRS